MDDRQFEQWMPLAHKLGRKMYAVAPFVWLTSEDAEQEAMVGLANGLRCYDPDHPSKAKLTTYLHTAIWRHLQRAACDLTMIHISSNRYFDMLEPPAEDDNEFTVAARKAAYVRQFPKYADDGSYYNPPDLREEIDQLDYLELSEAVGRLKPRHRAVLEHCFGLNGQTEKTLREVAEMYGVTKERVRQIKEYALEKLRKNVYLKRMVELV